MKCYFNDKNGGTIVAVLMVGLILNITIAVIYFSVNRSIRQTGVRRVDSSALHIAEAGKEHIYGSISSGYFTPVQNSSVEVFSALPFGDGTYTVICSTNNSADTIWVTAEGSVTNSPKTIRTVANLLPSIDFPTPNVRGAVNARDNIHVTGNVLIDGRDTCVNYGTVGDGVFAVSTCGEFSSDGNAHLSGMGLDRTVRSRNMDDTERAVLVEENYPETDIFNSPEEFLGLQPGALDQFKTSHAPDPPFRGIHYISNDVHTELGPLHLGDSYGILIVHNSSRTASLQINTGTFTGMIITDRVARLAGNTKILGAVATLSDDGEVINFEASGTPQIRYSSQVLANLNEYLDNLPNVPNEISWSED